MEHARKSSIDINELENYSPRTALHKMFYTFDSEYAERLKKILKIIMHEQFREEKAHMFMHHGMFLYNYKYIKEVLDRLISRGKLRPIRTDAYAKLFVSLLIAGSFEVMHFSADEPRLLEWDTDNNIMDFLIDQVVDDFDDGF